MSNESIIKRMREVCDKFESKQLTILELGHDLYAHGSGLENVENGLQEYVMSIESLCEEIEMENTPRSQYEKGMSLISKLKDLLPSGE